MSLGRVGIVGAGQIGTAIGLALRAAAAAREVLLHDRDADVVRRSLARGAGDRPGTLDETTASDVVILALPLDAIVATLERATFASGSLVIDTGTLKSRVVRAMRTLPADVHAVGGHPIAGTERPGPEGADPASLRGATFALCPARDDTAAIDRARALVSALGGVPLVLPADMHDTFVSRTILLPHLVAFAMRAIRVPEQLAGPGHRSVTRLAASDAAAVAAWSSEMSADLRVALAELREHLARYERSLDDERTLAHELAAP